MVGLDARARRAVLGSALALALAAAPRTARGSNDGAVHGVVEDALLRPLAGATVVLHDSAGHQVARTVTGPDGAFAFADVPYGDYTVEASAPGLTDDHEHLQLGAAAAAPIELVLVDTEEVVQITEDWPVAAPSRATGSVRTVGRQALGELPGGDARPITDVLTTQPGFVADGLGNVYARGNHASIQYQLDGIPVPDSVGSLFAASIPVRLIQSLDVTSGGMPAEFGQRLGAVVNLTTRQGTKAPEGSLALRYGAFDTLEPSGSYATSVAGTGLFLGGSVATSGRALDPPSIEPILHDRGVAARAFARVDRRLGPLDRLELFATYAHNRFQIPLDPAAAPFDPARPRPVDAYGNEAPAFVPRDTDATETEDEAFAAASWVHTWTCGCRLQVAALYKLSRGVLLGDAPRALGPTADPGATASDVARRAHHLGAMVGYAITRGGHVVKAGAQTDLLLGRTAFTAYGRDDVAGALDPARTLRGVDRTDALTTGAYLQDTWRRGALQVAAGLRIDHAHVALAGGASDDQVGVSPRLGASLALADDLVAHAFAGVGWQPPAPLDAAAVARALGVVPADRPVAYDLRPETDLYGEAGLDGRAWRRLRLGLTAWGRYAYGQLDDTSLGSTSLSANYNFDRGRAAGVEAAAELRVGPWLSAFANGSWGLAQGRGIASARYLFSAEDLASDAWQTLDHAQAWTGNAGATVREGRFSVSSLLAYGSGLRTGPANTAHVPGHVRGDLTMQYAFAPGGYPVRFAVDVINLFDARYAYRIANGFVGSAYAAPRAVFVTLSLPLAREAGGGALAAVSGD